jgi:hypothetical protein
VKHEPPLALTLPEKVEKVLISGDLSPLSPEERTNYYKLVCKSLGLNPLTMPFQYIVFRENDGGPGRLALYARKDCAEQLRKLYGIWCVSLKREMSEDVCMVEAHVRDKSGKEDFATGVVSLWKIKDGKRFKLDGKELCNAIMKAETKAKRRATLSICGLGFLDESEIETLENYSMVTPAGRVITESKPDAAQEVAQRKIEAHKQGKTIDVEPEPVPGPETITMTFLDDVTVALTGNGLAVAKAELTQEVKDELGIKHTLQKGVHMPAASAAKFIDRVEKFGVKAGFAPEPGGAG